MQTNFFSKTKRLIFRLFHKHQHVKISKKYSETELTGTGFTMTPTYFKDRFLNINKKKMNDI